MKNKALKITFLLIACAFILLFASLKWSFWEPGNVKHDSLTYKLKTNEEIKNFPIFDATNSPLYDYRIADGVKPSIVVQKYESSLNLLEVQDKLTSLGFSCEYYKSEKFVTCDRLDNKKREKSLVANHLNKGTRTRVEMAFIGY